MSLNWNISNTAWDRDHRDANGEPLDTWDRDWPIVETVIFGCLATEIGELRNEQDAQEWYYRYVLWNRIHGDGDPGVTFDEVVSLIGLRTNVFPRMTLVQWFSKIRKGLEWRRSDVIAAGTHVATERRAQRAAQAAERAAIESPI